MRVRRLHDFRVSPMGSRQIGEAGHAETGQGGFVGGPVQEPVDDGHDLGSGDFPLASEGAVLPPDSTNILWLLLQPSYLLGHSFISFLFNFNTYFRP